MLGTCPILSLSASPSLASHCALDEGFCQAIGPCDMPCHLAQSYCRQEIFVLPDVLADCIAEFLIGGIKTVNWRATSCCRTLAQQDVRTWVHVWLA